MSPRRNPTEGRIPRVPVRRLVAAKKGFLAELESIALRGSWQGGTLWAWQDLEGLRRRMLDLSEQTRSACLERGLSPADLPPPSRRAFQLISFLASGARLEDHLETEERLRRADERVASRLDHAGHLYRFQRDESGIQLEVSEGFLGAPDNVLAALVRLAVPYTRKQPARMVVRGYVEGPDFARRMREIEGSGGADESRPRGEVYDLADIFERVNASYFGGRLEAPRLVWSDRPTFREFGHFEPVTDTVQISRTLDSSNVPTFVIEHVMHHELLHRVLGAEDQGERRRFHSARFRRAESAFLRFREAEAFLQQLSEAARP